MDYRVWALLSAIFAGATAVLAKKGVEGVPPNLAVAIRVFFVFLFAAAIAAATRETGLSGISARTWGYLVASAIATGASWLCYFRALALGPVSKVAPVDKLSFVIAMGLGFFVLGEKVTPKLAGGAVLIVAGVLVTLA